ncbi:peptide/nickel transport system ATP-binding protein [Pseudonocardia thermophila]|uniref:Peptide/nickel transport system ATP-binding protein n=1 Tax=Pseudonocardia thermophila TaxID=1848 RepID=A0A1M6T468_PSETH|nr:ABC transporter ATP-binding protein [Pseudonocardia thermophila]SHK51751.1 peptide/nickel transport system ATP-binding protein [Pseudonocardia thermophila]
MSQVTEAVPTAGLSTDALSVWLRRADGRRLIAESIDLQVAPGESIAIVGESGSGKSVTARAVLDLLPPELVTEGDVSVGGVPFLRIGRAARHRMRGSEIAFVMQDPFTMLNPVMKVGDQVTAALRDANGRPLSRAARRAEAVARLREVGITDPAVADKYPFQLSGGMRQRVGIAAAIAENPQVLVADEPTTALDVTTQRDVLLLLDRLRRTHELGLVLITHDLRVAFATCDRVYVMYAGQIVEVARSDVIRRAPRHPYTAALLAADPPLDHRMARLRTIPGSVPAPGHRPGGCHFAPRCAFALPACSAAPVELQLTDDDADHRVRCVRAGEITLEPPTAQPGPEPAAALTTDGQPLVTVRDVRKVFRDKVAVDGVDIDVFAGESVGLVGESGSGKTTLARMIVGLTRPTSGTVEVGGVELTAGALSKEQWAAVRGTVQMAFQDPYSTLNPTRTIGSTLREGLRLAGVDDLEERTAELLERVGLPATYAQRRPGQLSGGERQRVAIARALSRSPRIVVCDEVVSALDVSVQAHILNLLRDLQADLGLTYVFITHDLAVVRQITDRVYVLNHGKVVESGLTSEVLDRPRHDYTRRLVASVPQADGVLGLPEPR